MRPSSHPSTADRSGQALAGAPAIAIAALSSLPPALSEVAFLRQRQLLKLIPISKTTLWRRVRDRTFPQPLKLSPNVTVWRAEDLRDWIAQQGQPRR